MNIEGTVLCSSNERIIMNWCVILFIYFFCQAGRRGAAGAVVWFLTGCLNATYAGKKQGRMSTMNDHLLATCCCIYLALVSSTIVYAGMGFALLELFRCHAISVFCNPPFFLLIVNLMWVRTFVDEPVLNLPVPKPIERSFSVSSGPVFCPKGVLPALPSKVLVNRLNQHSSWYGRNPQYYRQHQTRQ
jgi:hypothetical protein